MENHDNAVQDHNNHVVVLLNEEYGYKYHIWSTGMSPEEFESFWASIKDMGAYYMNPSKLLPGTFITADTEDDILEWEQKFNSAQYYVAHIHENDDSGLTTPDGRVIKHKGFVSQE